MTQYDGIYIKIVTDTGEYTSTNSIDFETLCGYDTYSLPQIDEVYVYIFDGDSAPYLEVPQFVSASEDCLYVDYYISTD